MKRWAQVQGGIVATVVEQDGFPSTKGPWIDCTDMHVGPGFGYDGSAFTAPVAKAHGKITAEAFWDRFTNAEMVSYDVAMQHDHAATNAAQRAAARLRIFQRDTDTAGFRRLSATKVRTFVTSLEGSVLAAGRAAVILDTPITADEAY